MRLAFFGDVVGKAGRLALQDHLPRLRADLRLDFVVANAENAVGGFGVTEPICQELFHAGCDALTLGNHAWDQRDALTYIAREPRLLRPANYPALTEAPGRGAQVFHVAGRRVLLVTVLGRLFMDALDCPFTAVDRELTACPLGAVADAVLVEIHAEATSEKQGMGHFCDGRASLVVGTHTHVPTADARVLPGGTAFQTDAGMCGDYDSVIGMKKEIAVRRLAVRLPFDRHQPAEGPGVACGVYVETDDRTGLARTITPIRMGEGLAQSVPAL
jgi:metallophosphoesterase (TIGR00282 family)